MGQPSTVIHGQNNQNKNVLQDIHKNWLRLRLCFGSGMGCLRIDSINTFGRPSSLTRKAANNPPPRACFDSEAARGEAVHRGPVVSVLVRKREQINVRCAQLYSEIRFYLLKKENRCIANTIDRIV